MIVRYIYSKGNITIDLSKTEDKWTYSVKFKDTESTVGSFIFTQDLLDDILNDLQHNKYGLWYMATESVFVGKLPEGFYRCVK